jgi:hypothetical protein
MLYCSFMELDSSRKRYGNIERMFSGPYNYYRFRFNPYNSIHKMKKEIRTMTGEQVCELLNICPKTLKRFRDNAYFSFYMISKHNIIYNEESVYKYLNSKRIV